MHNGERISLLETLFFFRSTVTVYRLIEITFETVPVFKTWRIVKSYGTLNMRRLFRARSEYVLLVELKLESIIIRTEKKDVQT